MSTGDNTSRDGSHVSRGCLVTSTQRERIKKQCGESTDVPQKGSTLEIMKGTTYTIPAELMDELLRVLGDRQFVGPNGDYTDREVSALEDRLSRIKDEQDASQV